MRVINSPGLYGNGVFGQAMVRPTSLHPSRSTSAESSRPIDGVERQQQLRQTLSQVVQLRQTLKTFHAQLFGVTGTGAVAPVSTTSSSLELRQTGTSTVLQSREEVNATTTSFSQVGPTFRGSTAAATVGGTYDGSGGSGTLTFLATRGGTHGVDDLRFDVYNPDGGYLQRLTLNASDPIDQTYTLQNGLTLNLGAGTVLRGDTFSLDVEAPVQTALSPSEQPYVGSTAQATVGGTYDGSGGSGTLRFLATRGGTHGANDLRFNVYNPDGQLLQRLTLNADDPIDQTYTLENGLTVTLGAGSLLKGDAFSVEVEASEPTVISPAEPSYAGSTAAATVGGTYDGSGGSGTLTFLATRGGTHGVNDLRFDVYNPDGRMLQRLAIHADDPIDQTYTLENGLTLNLGAGSLLKGDAFSVEVEV